MSQRLHEDDPAGHLLEQQPDAWLLVRIPLEAEEDETYVLPLSGYELKRSAGEVLQPERFTQNVVRALKDSSNWGGQYQQRPSPEQGGIIKKPWWRFYVRPGQPKPEGCLVLPDSFDEMAQSWDMSFKDKKTSDYVCGGVWGRVGAMKYLMPDIVWDRLDFVGTKKAVIALSVRWPFTYSKWIEDKANGSAIIAELQTEISGLIAVEPMGSKEARLHAAAPAVEAGNVILPHPSIALAIAQVCVRDFEPAIISIRKAAEVDPLGPLFQAHVAWILNCAGKSEEAWNQLQSSLELHPSDYYANRILMYVAQTPERCRRAIEKVQRIAGLTRSGRHASAGVLGVLHARLGAREKALEIAAQLEQVVSSEHAAAYILALIHCLLGNLEVAVDWLERAEQTGAGLLIILGCEPTLGPLRPLERFQVLLKRLGLS